MVWKDNDSSEICRVIVISLRPIWRFCGLQLARLDPAQAIVGPTPRLVDEWQEEPKLWDAVRFECDVRGGEPGQFILTGSATPRAENQPMHSGVVESPVCGWIP